MDPAGLKFARTHEWVRVDGEVATVGISEFAVKQLSDLVYVDLPKPGRTVGAGEAFGEVESVKAVSDLYAPVSGEVVEVNEALADHLDWLSDDAFGQGWMVKLRIGDRAPLEELMDWPAYQQHCDSEAH